MNVRFFDLLLVATLTFFWTFETRAVASHPIQQFVPSTATNKADISKMSHRCPYLDPCKIGNNYLELFEKIRKSVNCPPQPQRCSLNNTATPVTQPASTTMSTTTNPSLNPFSVLWCPYLQSDFENKDFLQKYEEILKSIGCPLHPKSAISNVTSTSVVPAMTNGIAGAGTSNGGRDDTNDTIAIKKADFATAIFEAMTSVFRKFHY